jgi:hypothetical protein
MDLLKLDSRKKKYFLSLRGAVRQVTLRLAAPMADKKIEIIKLTYSRANERAFLEQISVLVIRVVWLLAG